MMPVPSNIQHSAYASFPVDALLISLLNKNSCAISCGIELDQEGRGKEETGCAYLHQASVQQNSRAQRVHNTANDGRRCAAWVVGGTYSKANCNSHWRRDGV